MPERIRNKENYFDKLDSLMHVLREECSWDKEQTLSSLRKYTLEETHEVLEAIEQADQHDQWEPLKSELGDLLIQVAFYSVIAEEQNKFSMADVFDTLIEKMIYRHPHVFGDARPDDVVAQWEALKQNEHQDRQSPMDGIPPLPALAYAQKQQQRAARVGFDWEKPDDVMAKMREELDELQVEIESDAPHSRLEDEFGDVLFTLVNYARKLGLDAEQCLMQTNRKFATRFRKMESLALDQGLDFAGLSLDEKEELYQQAKEQLK